VDQAYSNLACLAAANSDFYLEVGVVGGGLPCGGCSLYVTGGCQAGIVAHHWIHSSKPLFLIASGLAAAFHAIKLWSIAGGACPEIFVKEEARMQNILINTHSLCQVLGKWESLNYQKLMLPENQRKCIETKMVRSVTINR